MAGRPRLSRQESVQHVQENHKHYGTGLNCCLFPPAVAALTIASTYNWSTSPCNGTEYTIDPILYLKVAGGIQCGYVALFVISLCISENFTKALSGLTCPLSLFFFIWSVIGLVIYVDQMNPQCQEEDLALMILSFASIDIGVRILACACLTCFICCAGVFMGIAAVADAEDESENRRLKAEDNTNYSSV